MTIPIIAGAFLEVYVKELGFSQDTVREVISGADRVELLEYEGLKIGVYVKAFGGRKPSILVVTVNLAPESRVLDALRLYQDFPGSLSEVRPLELVELFARRFGVDVTIGPVKDRFILKQEIPVSTNDPTRVIKVPTDREVKASFFVRISEEKPLVASCAIAWALDVVAYRAYLRRWER